MRILLVEDNDRLSEWLGQLLEGRGHAVDRVRDAEHADAALAAFRYDLVVLDLGLPGRQGLEFLRDLRRRGDTTAVLILTASDGATARVAGLDSGADDYLAKPFAVEELEARIRALLRRAKGRADNVLRFGRLVLDETTGAVDMAGVALALTPRERAVLTTLLIRAGGVVPKDALVEAVFGFNEDASAAAIELYVHRVRRKLAGSGLEIVTLRGIGYALREDRGDGA
jgi:two-component system response regulator TctD